MHTLFQIVKSKATHQNQSQTSWDTKIDKYGLQGGVMFAAHALHNTRVRYNHLHISTHTGVFGPIILTYLLYS